MILLIRSFIFKICDRIFSMFYFILKMYHIYNMYIGIFLLLTFINIPMIIGNMFLTDNIVLKVKLLLKFVFYLLLKSFFSLSHTLFPSCIFQVRFASIWCKTLYCIYAYSRYIYNKYNWLLSTLKIKHNIKYIC